MDATRAHIPFPNGNTQRFRREHTNFNTPVPPPTQVTAPVPQIHPRVGVVNSERRPRPGGAVRLPPRPNRQVQLHETPPAPNTESRTEDRFTHVPHNRVGNEYVQEPCLRISPIITTQPTDEIKKKSVPSVDQSVCNHDRDQHLRSMVSPVRCHICDGCRCKSCQAPMPLPSTWCCDRKYECSASKCVDIMSCMCVVKGCFYHCFPDPDGCEEVDIMDHPCGCCEQRHCCKRWTYIGMLLPCLPCLLCYCPLNSCVSLASKCYNCVLHQSRTDRCRCSTGQLLLDSESSSV